MASPIEGLFNGSASAGSPIAGLFNSTLPAGAVKDIVPVAPPLRTGPITPAADSVGNAIIQQMLNSSRGPVDLSQLTPQQPSANAAAYAQALADAASGQNTPPTPQGQGGGMFGWLGNAGRAIWDEAQRLGALPTTLYNDVVVNGKSPIPFDQNNMYQDLWNELTGKGPAVDLVGLAQNVNKGMNGNANPSTASPFIDKMIHNPVTDFITDLASPGIPGLGAAAKATGKLGTEIAAHILGYEGKRVPLPTPALTPEAVDQLLGAGPESTPNMSDQEIVNMLSHQAGEPTTPALPEPAKIPQLPGNSLANVEPQVLRGEGSVRTPKPGPTVEGQFTELPPEQPTVATRSTVTPETMRYISAGQQLQNDISNFLKSAVGRRVGIALNKIGVGSGLNLLPSDLRNVFLDNRGELGRQQNAILNEGLNMVPQMGDINNLENARDVFESTGQASPEIQRLRDLTDNGVEGTLSGLNAEKAYDIAPNELLDNYLHLSLDPKSIPLGDPLRKELSRQHMTRGYAKTRYFKTAAQARGAGYRVRNPLTSTIDRILESNRDLMNHKLWLDMRDRGMQSIDPKTGLPHVSAEAQKGLKEFRSTDVKHPLNGHFLNPHLHQLATTMDRMPLVHSAHPLVSTPLKAFDRLTHLFRVTGLYNGLVHNHNTFGNALVAFGLHPKNWESAVRVLRHPEKSSPYMQHVLDLAEKTGALGNDMHGTDPLTQIDRAMAGKSAQRAYSKFQNATLWDREKELRLGVFKQAFEYAKAQDPLMTDISAAHVARDVTNQHMVDYSNHNLSTLEREVMTRLDPFYKWHKGNYALQFRKLASPAALTRAGKVDLAFNRAQKDMTGQEQANNLGGNADQEYKLQIPLGNGQFMSVDPYLPWAEPFKMANATLGNFLYTRLNPYLREGVLQGANREYYPTAGVAPDDKQYLSDQNHEIANPESPMGQQWLSRLSHLFQNTVGSNDTAPNIASALGQLFGIQPPQGKYPTVPAADQVPVDVLGGFTSSSPTSADKLAAQQYLENQYIGQQLLDLLKQQPGYNSKSPATKAAVKQIEQKLGIKTIP